MNFAKDLIEFDSVESENIDGFIQSIKHIRLREGRHVRGQLTPTNCPDAASINHNRLTFAHMLLDKSLLNFSKSDHNRTCLSVMATPIISTRNKDEFYSGSHWQICVSFHYGLPTFVSIRICMTSLTFYHSASLMKRMIPNRRQS